MNFITPSMRGANVITRTTFHTNIVPTLNTMDTGSMDGDETRDYTFRADLNCTPMYNGIMNC